MQNTASIPAFVRWALAAGYDYVLTGILETDDVEAANAELRQAGGDRRNPSFQSVIEAIPQINLAKQSMRLIALPKGTNVDPQLQLDPSLSTDADWARRLASAPAIQARPTTSAAARRSAPTPFQQLFYYGKICASFDKDHVYSVDELKDAEAQIQAKKFKKQEVKVEISIASPDELCIYKLDDRKGKEKKSLDFKLTKAQIQAVASGSRDSRLVFLEINLSLATARPIRCYAFKIKPTPAKAQEFFLKSSQLFVSE
jgi:hypothetical protein